MLLLFNNPELKAKFTEDQEAEMDKELDAMIEQWMDDHCGAQPRDQDHAIRLQERFERKILLKHGIKA